MADRKVFQSVSKLAEKKVENWVEMRVVSLDDLRAVRKASHWVAELAVKSAKELAEQKAELKAEH